MTLQRLHFLTPGNYEDDRPGVGLEDTLQLFEYAEQLGYDGGWIRQRHLEHGVSAAAVFLAAASQRTRRIELGTAVIPIGYESPVRLAEDLATVDVLSGGRLQPGFSTGMPHPELLADLVHDGDWHAYDLGYERIERVRRALSGEYLGDPDTRIESPGNVQRPRVQPYSPGLIDRLWYGGTSARSVSWSAQHGYHLLTGNIISGEGATDFAAAQRDLIERYREEGGAGTRVGLGRVILPTDSASPATRERYGRYVESRTERTRTAHGPRGILFAPDVIGSADQIVETLTRDAAYDATDELRLELPYEFDLDDYRQILFDFVKNVAPQLGWRPAVAAVSA